QVGQRPLLPGLRRGHRDQRRRGGRPVAGELRPLRGGLAVQGARHRRAGRPADRRRVRRPHRGLRSRSRMSLLNTSLLELDPAVAAAVDAELHRQQSTLEMIASENFAPVAVMEAQGSVLTNKYAEGYPGRRYYGGCEHVDVI